ncbi:hypothetical protein [Thiocapsa sp.]|uniref:hypothetical protein n=1 Tax=Thiocapsa sp. TaxID=2024551 RepID=UPI002BCBF71C|nr:hypothetical protein [Thiocapsa sp.]HSO81791.1 hypothetical protein [Thiocapsa sp.]
MHALKLTATIDSSRRLKLQLPADTPEGEAEIIVLVDEDEEEEVKVVAKGEVKPASSLRAYFEELDRQPLSKTYTREEMDAYLAQERASWD